MDQVRETQVPAGTIRYREAGTGPAIVFVHGYLVDGRLWDGVAEALADRFHVVVPDLPFGAHKVPMAPDAQLDAAGLATIVDDFIAALGLEDVTLVGNDSGGAVSQVLVSRRPARVARLVLTNCDTYENFPPGIFKAMPPIAKLPGGMWAMAQPFRIPAVSRRAFAAFTKSGARDDLVADWTSAALSDRALMRDLAKVTAGLDKRFTLAAAAALRGTRFPLLLVWAPGDRYFPLAGAERLAADVGGAKLVQVSDSATFVPLDQPKIVATNCADFAPSP
ncbi:MAG TPA: alpha/beta hydrolase [Solirubrobacterales bacterium]|jgi:pimeloyl-ACP methyl ester carboxylesterase|nr:alpha/beta hydrolase [Solirubrobacterales bacterium]